MLRNHRVASSSLAGATEPIIGSGVTMPDPERAKIKADIDKEAADFYLDICLKGSNDLRSILGFDDDSYRFVHHRATRKSRNYYMYGVLNEIEKAGFALMKAKEFLSGPSPALNDRVTRNIAEAAEDELALWVRKLVELLTELILFSQINDDAYYRHYMLVKELKGLNTTVENAKKAYGCHVQNYQKQVEDIKSELLKLENSAIDLEKCWYLPRGKKSLRVSGAKGVLSRLDDRINAAFQLADADQIIALGISYGEGYDNFSDAIHFNALDTSAKRVSLESLHAKVSGIGVLSANSIIQARKLLSDRRRKGWAAFIAKIFREGSEAKKILRQRINPGIKVGDFVNAQGDLAEVVRIMRGQYGFRSFRVKFLLAEDTEVAGKGSTKTVWTHHNPKWEEYPAIWVRKLYSRADILADLKNEILKHDPNEDVRTKTLTPFLRESVVHLWKNVGLKESVKGQREQALEKMNQELTRIKKGERPPV
jgi:hypothetical protein